MRLKKKMGFLLLVCSFLFLFVGINFNITGNIVNDYFSNNFMGLHILGFIFLIGGLALFIEQKSLDYLIVPTGDSVESNLIRAKKGREQKSKHYIISGIIKGSLRDSKTKKIYDELRNVGGGYKENQEIKPSQIIIEGKSKDTLENMIYSLKKIKNAKNVGIVSYPEHLKRFKMIIKEAKKEGKVPKSLKVKYIPTKQNLWEKAYGVLANVKEKYRLRKGLDEAMKKETKGFGKFLKKSLENKN